MILNNDVHFYLIFFLIILSFCNSSIIIFPFKSVSIHYLTDYRKNKNNNLSNSSIFFDNSYIYKYITNFKIGSPPQDIISPLELYLDSFFIKEITEKELYKDNNKGYIYKDSSTFRNMTNIKYSKDDYIGEDILYLYTSINDIKLNKLSCLHNIKFDIEHLNNRNNNKYYTLSIGLNLDDSDSFNNFMRQIYNTKYISFLIVSFIYKEENNNDINYIIKDNDGIIIIGNFPHQILPDKYKEENYVSFYSNQPRVMFFTNFFVSFDEISTSYKNNKYIIKDNRAILSLNSGLIIGNEEYLNFIEKNFFEKYYKLNICNKYITKTDYISEFIILSCNKEINNILKTEEFPILYFYIKSKEIIFEFSYEDLFKKINNTYYFLVSFETKTNVWHLGKPFLSKYSFVYNGEAKTLGFYKYINNKNNKKINNKDEPLMIQIQTKKLFFFIFILIIFIIIIVFISFRYGKKINFVRKKLANELDDDNFEYNSKKCNYNKDINDDNKYINDNEKNLELIEKRKILI